MPTTYQAPSYESLLAEQADVQAAKFQGRLLRDYNSYIFPGQSFREPRSCAVTDLVRPLIGTYTVSLEGVLAGLHERKEDAVPVHWADMGGGRGLAQRQAASDPALQGKIAYTNVDLFDYGLDGLDEEEMAYLDQKFPGITDPAAEPTLVRDNAETVILPKKADLITSVEGIQYLHNPLGALSNWYNQLKDEGLLIIATEHTWPSWIRYDRSAGEECPPLAEHLLQQLGRAGITFAATEEADWKNGRPELRPSWVRTLAIQKKAGTLLTAHFNPTEVWSNGYSYKATYYPTPDATGKMPLEAVNMD